MDPTIVQGCLIGIPGTLNPQAGPCSVQMSLNIPHCVVQPKEAMRPSPTCARLSLSGFLYTLRLEPSLNFNSLTLLGSGKSFTVEKSKEGYQEFTPLKFSCFLSEFLEKSLS